MTRLACFGILYLLKCWWWCAISANEWQCWLGEKSSDNLGGSPLLPFTPLLPQIKIHSFSSPTKWVFWGTFLGEAKMEWQSWRKLGKKKGRPALPGPPHWNTKILKFAPKSWKCVMPKGKKMQRKYTFGKQTKNLRQHPTIASYLISGKVVSELYTLRFLGLRGPLGTPLWVSSSVGAKNLDQLNKDCLVHVRCIVGKSDFVSGNQI